MNRPAVYAVDAPAKINLHLEILGRRPDGFHDLRSLFLMLDWGDRVIVRTGAAGDGFAMTGGDPLDPRDNTLIRARDLFRESTGIAGGLEAGLVKRIPAGGGLGGGSSDAAALLRLLNEAFGRPLSEPALAGIGARIGSDVPFFLSGPCAVVEGRGESVRPCPGPAGIVVALVVPSFAVWTAEAYRLLDEAARPATRGPSAPELAAAVRSQPPARWGFFNSFSPVILPRFPEYGIIMEAMRDAGALHQGLSGSGSAYFGVFDDQARAHACLERLPGTFRFKGLARPLAEPASITLAT